MKPIISPMDDVEELYQEILLDHYRNPRNKQPCHAFLLRAHQSNLLCGDEIVLGIELAQDSIGKIAFEGHGCSISQASASMLTEAVSGMTKTQALDLIEKVRHLTHGDACEEDLGDVMALKGVSKFPVRVKCALLPWMALKDALFQKNARPP